MKLIKAVRQYRLLSIRISSYHFNPGIVSTLVTIALLYTMMSLGFWQAERAQYKETLQQKILERKILSPLDIDTLPAAQADKRFLPVKFSAKFDTQHSFLLDNKTLNGRVGYHVYTAVLINDFKAILINRGFVAMARTRDILPEISTPDGTIEISGLLDKVPSRALVLAENVQDTSRWPVVLQYVDLDEISQMLGYELFDMVLILDQGSIDGFEYDLPVLNLNAAKNNGYAFQWFAMSLALLLIYIVVNSKKILKK